MGKSMNVNITKISGDGEVMVVPLATGQIKVHLPFEAIDYKAYKQLLADGYKLRNLLDNGIKSGCFSGFRKARVKEEIERFDQKYEE